MNRAMRANRTDTVVVLGATGFAGRTVMKELAARRISALGTSRSREAAGMLVREVREAGPFALLDAEAIDADDGGVLRQLFRRASVVVNCVGPYIKTGVDVVRAAIETGTHYLDVASEEEFYRRIRPLSSLAAERNCFVGVGLGAYPGLSGLLLLHLLHEVQEPASAEITLAMTAGSEEGGLAQILSAILEMNFPLEELSGGRLVPVPPGTATTRTLPSPFGPTKLLRWPQLEVLACAELGLVPSVATYVTLGRPAPSKLSIALIRWLAPHRRPWAYQLLTRIAQRRTETHRPMATPVGHAIIRISVRGPGAGRYADLTLPTAAATAWLPAELCARLLQDQRYGIKHAGVHTALDLPGMDRVLDLAQEAGAALKKWTEP